MSTSQPDFTHRLLSDAGVRVGMRVLDIGCGSGEVTLLAARLVGLNGTVVGIDQDENALSMARQRIHPEGAAATTFIQGDLLSMPEALGNFDAIVGRRVLMYQADTVQTVRALAARLRPGGIIVFQEHDSTMVPASLTPFPLHAQAQGWIRRMIELEGADLHIGFNLHRILTQAGLVVENVRAECLVQTPSSAYGLGSIVRACLPRVVAHGVATAEEIKIDTLQARLDAEQAQTDSIYIGDVMFGAWARKPMQVL
ncbi:methyltransferase domain-containing protein [Pseudomonas sp. 10S4]|uniref:methyltransferase domain-containing protein n=1 Tax=Pseudomonas sp. 10S4 TaxID=3048583 RepID=UPI002AC8A70F|nr:MULTISPECIES: methyltransferase domain-containing protein [unclassified Pseudomonas]MEB0228170.1 methyltransferase domain-containing protein [Pseudomonas sp. 5S1]MEB0296970.1 methyltransferase domain-containing protein [Pseudomonas sp. 10S4]WPX17947.1 methyltransferase domain-containing protein [Pseudomonas sp. 10S4]